MKVIILAGGWGSRLGQLSNSIPKPMVTIGNKPILWHIMKSYSNYGYNDFIIALGVKQNLIKEYFYNYESINNDFTIDLSTSEISYHNKENKSKWSITLVDTGLNTLKGGRIKRLEKYLTDEVNMITYGDGVSDINIGELVNFHKSHGKTITITGVHPPARFGEIVEDQGKVLSFNEKPQTSVGLINGGYMVFNRNLLELLTEDEDCDFEFGPLQKMASNNQIKAFIHDEFWQCMDNVRERDYLNKLAHQGDAPWVLWK